MSLASSDEHFTKLSQWFSKFSEQAQESKFYADLAFKISQDSELIAMIPDNRSQPVPNLFLATINYLLYKHPESQLSYFYPNHRSVVKVGGYFKEFKSFCFVHKDEIIQLMSKRLVQTNEVLRSALLLPAIHKAAAINGPQLSLIDVGASAGLNLMADYYRIQYSDGSLLGDPKSEVTLNCQLRGRFLSVQSELNINERIGIDLNPINLKDEDEFLWSLSLFWPDQVDRISRFKKAAHLFRRGSVQFKKGSGLELILPTTLELPSGSHICIMHSFTLNQLSRQDQLFFEGQLKLASVQHRISRISLEWLSGESPEMKIDFYRAGERQSSIKVADCHQHGEWLNWLENSV